MSIMSIVLRRENQSGIANQVLATMSPFSCLTGLTMLPGTEFLYPSSWLGDQTLLKRAAQRAELERSLDPPALKRQRARDVVEPCAAFGPAGSR